MKIAVTGSTGRLGNHVVRRLESPGTHDVVGLTRKTAPYEDVVALSRALSGVDTLVFVSSDGEAAKVILHHQNVLEAAVDARVRHVVLLSGVDADLSSPFCYAYTNGYTEELLRSSGMDYSIGRASLFREFFEALVRQCATEGVVRIPAGGGRVSLVGREEVADCLATLALTGPTNRYHDLTGPTALDVADVARAGGWAYEEIPEAEFAAALALSGEEPWWVYAYATMFASIREKRWETVTDEVSRLTAGA